MRTIVKSQRTFSGEGWVSYDTCFRRKAAISKSLEWGVIDFTLYNETFTGRAKAMARCRYCSSDMHTSQDCVYAPTTAQSSGSSWSHPSAQRPEKDKPLCQLFNARTNRCPFNPCRFRHNCAECDGRHPRSLCRRNAPPEKIPTLLKTGCKNCTYMKCSWSVPIATPSLGVAPTPLRCILITLVVSVVIALVNVVIALR